MYQIYCNNNCKAFMDQEWSEEENTWMSELAQCMEFVSFLSHFRLCSCSIWISTDIFSSHKSKLVSKCHTYSGDSKQLSQPYLTFSINLLQVD